MCWAAHAWRLPVPFEMYCYAAWCLLAIRNNRWCRHFYFYRRPERFPKIIFFYHEPEKKPRRKWKSFRLDWGNQYKCLISFFHRQMIMISNIPGFDYHIGILGRYEFKMQSTTIVSKIFLSMLRFCYPLIEFVVNWQMHHNWTIRNCAFVSCRTLLLDLGSGTKTLCRRVWRAKLASFKNPRRADFYLRK